MPEYDDPEIQAAYEKQIAAHPEDKLGAGSVLAGQAAPTRPVPVAAPARPPEAAAALAEIARIKADPAHPSRDDWAPGHQEAHAALMGLYKAAHGGAAEPEPPEEYTSADAVKDAELPEGVTWDAEAVQMLHQTGAAQGYAADDVNGFLLGVAAAGQQPPLGDQEAVDAAMREWWGEAYEAKATRAVASIPEWVTTQEWWEELDLRPAFWINLDHLLESRARRAASVSAPHPGRWPSSRPFQGLG